LLLSFVILSFGQNLCQDCEAIVGAIDTFIENNATDAEIAAYLDQICSLNPAFQTECDAIVSYGVPFIINFIKSNASPQQVCQILQLCSTKRRVQDEYCSFCQMLISAVEGYLASNTSIEQIEQNLDQICNFLSSGFSTYCQAMVAQEIPTIIGYIQNNETPVEICQEFGLCTTAHKVRIIKVKH